MKNRQDRAEASGSRQPTGRRRASSARRSSPLGVLRPTRQPRIWRATKGRGALPHGLVARPSGRLLERPGKGTEWACCTKPHRQGTEKRTQLQRRYWCPGEGWHQAAVLWGEEQATKRPFAFLLARSDRFLPVGSGRRTDPLAR